MRQLYSLLFLLLIPVVLLRLWWRGRANPGYRRRWRERFARLPTMRQNGIWLHAVSVGETLAAAPLIEALLQKYPELPITVTTTTPTGSERVHALFGQRVQHVYAPYDLPWLLRRFLRHVKPQLALVMETELWPNMVHSCAEQNVPLVVINARLSKRSARGYYKARCLSVPMLKTIAFIAAQERSDERRFIALGVHPERIEVTGTIKSDVRVSEAQRAAAKALRERLGESRYVVIAASTHDGEDAIVLDAFKQLRGTQNDAALILVPRHPERFDAVTKLAEASGFRVARRSQNSFGPDTDILIGDTMGELMMLYGVADAAFVGGSLVARGGHNPLEPLAWQLPVQQGPHTFNFATLTRRLGKAGVIDTITNAESLARVWRDFSAASTRSERAAQIAPIQRQLGGTLARLLVIVETILESPR